MPIYVFKCGNCEEELEIKSSIAKKIPNRRKCPFCQKNRLGLIIFSPHVYNKPGDGEISVGLLSQRNTDRFSHDRIESLNDKNQTGVRVLKKNGNNFWDTSKQTSKKIQAMSTEQKQRYVETGEM